MEWKSEGIILKSQKFSEDSRILTVFSEDFGKNSGIFKNIKQSIQIGDINYIIWKGRSVERLGTFKIENIFSPFSYVIEISVGLYAIQSACTLCTKGLPERAPHKNLFQSLKNLLLSLKFSEFSDCMLSYAYFEIDFLKEIGFGLDLQKCAVTGDKKGLFYLSPKTGKAVTKEVGEKYKDKLFIIPKFLLSNNFHATKKDILYALKITEHFLRYFFESVDAKDIPAIRSRLIEEFQNLA